MSKVSVLRLFMLVFVSSLMTAGACFANLDVVKKYKSAFGTDDKPKCVTCHVDKIPKKEDGKHEFNDYGKKVFAAKSELKKEKVDEEVLTKAGKNENAEF